MHGPDNAHMLKVAVEKTDGTRTRESDALCTQCHIEPGRIGQAGRSGLFAGSADAWSAHTHHAPESQGSRCIECHMSDVNWRLFTRRRDHTFQPPVPELTARFGVPNACTTCHENRSPEWAAKTMDEWYGNQERRRAVVRLSDTMYRAGTGDAEVLPEVARLAADRSHGTLIRASAAEFAGQLLAKSHTAAAATVNLIIGAAADREPAVRITAVRALSQLSLISDPRVTSVIAAHLNDDSRLVRVSAAEALMAYGITHLDGEAGRALARAQDEWTESLSTFNDVASDHTMLGRLEEARGRGEQAAKAWQTAIGLDPKDPEPHVLLGVFAARAGRYEEALQHFKTAKTLAPAYRNLDRLIEEAAKRSSKGG